MNKIVLAFAMSLLFIGCGFTPDGDTQTTCDLTCVGPEGPQGPQGPQGLTGPVGATGERGPTGPAGPVGPTGPQGPAGATGAQGPQGLPGAQGPQGLPGATGATGAMGPQGTQGPQGIRGAVGPAGPVGPAGVAGPTTKVLSASGEELGYAIPWRTLTAGFDVALLAYKTNPPADFPQGWIIPVEPFDFIHYTGPGCTGLPLYQSSTGYSNLRFSNYLFYVKGYNVLYKKAVNQQGGTSSASKRHPSTGTCMAGDGGGTYVTLEDSTYRMQVATTLPWQMVVE